MQIDGGCHCGNITYSAEVDLEKVGICHCTDCQTLSGSAFRVSVSAAKDAFHLNGELKIYIKTAESGASAPRRSVPSAARRFMRRRRGTRGCSISASARCASALSSGQNHKDGADRRATG